MKIGHVRGGLAAAFALQSTRNQHDVVFYDFLTLLLSALRPEGVSREHRERPVGSLENIEAI